MIFSIISFTENGMLLSSQIQEIAIQLPEITNVHNVTKWSGVKTYKAKDQNDLPAYVSDRCAAWAGKEMEEKHALLFIGACGIAVRAIAPYVENKLYDSPVLVADELGTYVIPILSGHMGGANELALKLAEKMNAIPVITTATDLNGAFSVDMFAKRNHLAVVNKSGIARVSSKVLQGEPVKISMEPYPPNHPVDVVITTEHKPFGQALVLRPKCYIIGMGCRKGKEPEKIEAFIAQTLEAFKISPDQIDALASIDVKKEETGLIRWSERNRVPFLTYSAQELNGVQGDFSSSGFVKSQVGVDNVCERAALIACGEGGELVVKKQAYDGMTIAIAKRIWSVNIDET